MKPSFERLRHWMWLPVTAFALLIGASEGGGGVTGTGSVACGAISDFGSVFVNGVEYFTNTANIVIDGVPGQSESRLRVGMVVRVDGAIFGATGQAATLTYDPDIRGAVDAPVTSNAGGPFFTVDGIGVQVNSRTFIDGAIAADQLAAGDRVEVSGLRDYNTGDVVALRVSRINVAAGTALTGRIANVTPTSFLLGSITVTYDGTTLRDAPSGLADGMVVRVKSAADPVGGVLAASEVRAIDGNFRAAAGTEASAQGVVSGLTTSTFSLGGFTIGYNSSETRFVDGTAADLANGAIVEAEGVLDANGVLLAQKITFPAGDKASVDAMVTSKSANGFTLVANDGVQVVVDAGTKWRDRSAAKMGTLGLTQLAVGDRVSVTGAEVAAGVVSADNVTRLDPAQGLTLYGRARADSGSAVSLLSLQAMATGSTTYQDADGTLLGASAFFAKAVGRTVKASGVASGSDVIVSSFEIEP
jgi:hypothetical protein